MCNLSPNSCPAKKAKLVGDKNPAKRPEVRKKISEINSELFKSGSELRVRCADTLKERYGVDNPMQIPDSVDKFVQSRRANGSFKWRFDILDPVVRQKIRDTRIRKGYIVDPVLREPFEHYERCVDLLTKKTYEKHKTLLNPNTLPRGRTRDSYQLDHKISKVDGFRLGIEPELLAHPMNLEMLTMTENVTKSNKSSITLEQLLEAIQKFEETTK